MDRQSRNEATLQQRQDGQKPTPRRFRIEAVYLNGQKQPQEETQAYPVGLYGLPKLDTAEQVRQRLNQELLRKGPQYYENQQVGGQKEFVSVKIVDQRTKLVLSSTLT